MRGDPPHTRGGRCSSTRPNRLDDQAHPSVRDDPLPVTTAARERYVGQLSKKRPA